MLKIQNLNIIQSGKTLLENANAEVLPGQKIGIIGKNGAGKTTLFNKIIERKLSEGVFISKSAKVSIIKQQIDANDFNLSAINYCLKNEVKEGLEQKELSKLVSKAHKILHGLGFKSNEMNQSLKEFSGGWKMRLNLSQVLISDADLILLDEPTNHLDLESIIWLEVWLKKSKSSCLIISHDRYFLDNIVTKIISFEQNQFKEYTGNYSEFLIQKEINEKNQAKIIVKNELKKQKLENFINTFGAKASKASQAQSKVKQLEKIEEVKVFKPGKNLEFNFFDSIQISNPVIEINNLCLGYDINQTILEKINLSILNNDKIGLFGVNGCGKSTLIKFLSNADKNIKKITGEVKFNKKINIGYYSQDHFNNLDFNKNLIQHIESIDPSLKELEIRNYLGKFKFTDKQAFQKIKSLSGGEKARLILASISYKRPNILLLDEPTNHLDFDMRNSLISAIKNFKGAIILISHDRYFMENTVEKYYLISNKKISLSDSKIFYIKEKFQPIKDTASTTSNNKIRISLQNEVKKLELELKNNLSKLNYFINKSMEINLEDKDYLNKKKSLDELKNIKINIDNYQKKIAEIEEKVLNTLIQIDNLNL